MARRRGRVCRPLRRIRSGDHLSVVGSGKRRLVAARCAGDLVSRIERVWQRGLRHWQPALSRAQSIKQLGPLARRLGSGAARSQRDGGRTLESRQSRHRPGSGGAARQRTPRRKSRTGPPQRRRAAGLVLTGDRRDPADERQRGKARRLAARRPARFPLAAGQGERAGRRGIARWFRQVKPSNEKYTLTVLRQRPSARDAGGQSVDRRQPASRSTREHARSRPPAANQFRHGRPRPVQLQRHSFGIRAVRTPGGDDR